MKWTWRWKKFHKFNANSKFYFNFQLNELVGKVDYSHNFHVFLNFWWVQIFGLSILIILTSYMIINGESFVEIFLLVYSSLSYSLITSMPLFYTIIILVRVRILNNIISKKFPKENQFRFLRLIENIEDRANKAISMGSQQLGPLAMFSITVIFLHSIFFSHFILHLKYFSWN